MARLQLDLAIVGIGMAAAGCTSTPPPPLAPVAVLYQPSYPATGFAQVRLVSEAMRSVICISLFQASQHAWRMAS